jgi:putative ABC transport system permease protein
MFFASFALLCIIIAFLGLYGISAYSIEQRTREIGIRKVLGADINEIIYLLGKEFFILIIIAGILASSLAVYFLTEWLRGFAYHTQLTPLPFITGIASAFIVAIFAVMIHAWKAARLNPVDLIKYE